MIELVLRFKNPVNVLFFLAGFAFNIAWVYLWIRRKRPIPFAPVIVANTLSFLAWGMLSEINHDDTGYMHFAWLISRGLVPFRDFWDHHSPLLPVLFAPVIKLMPPSIFIFDAARIFSLGMFLINACLGWAIAARVWREKARLTVYLLLLTSIAAPAHFFLLRPDLFMIFLLLVQIYVSCDIPGPRITPSFAAGIAVSLAASFSTKQYFMIFLPVIVISFGLKERRAAKVCAYLAGLCTGALPLAAYLIGNGIVHEYLFWTVGFNRRILMVTVFFPLLILLAGGWGAYCLYRRFKKSQDQKALVLVSAFILSSFSSLTTTSNLDGLYYLGFWYFVCAIAASGVDFRELSEKIKSVRARSIVIGVVFGFLLIPNLVSVWVYRHNDYAQGKKAAAELLNYSRDDSCVALLPVHPVFVRDALRLYSGWQYYFTERYASVREDAVRGGGIARRIIDSRPAVVMCRYEKRDMILELFQKQLISAADYKELVAFFRDWYTQKPIGVDSYYVRKDKLGEN
jgi:hypothetical protein